VNRIYVRFVLSELKLCSILLLVKEATVSKVEIVQQEGNCLGGKELQMSNNLELILYTTMDGVIKVDVTFEDETVWLTQEQMAELFQKSKSTINEHIRNIYTEGELQEQDTMRKFGNSEFSTKPTNFYNLDVIISVGYRVKSHHAVKFAATRAVKILQTLHLVTIDLPSAPRFALG